MSLDFTDDQSILVQVMAWCRQAAIHYLSQCWPRSLLSYGVTRPQWVKVWVNMTTCRRRYVQTHITEEMQLSTVLIRFYITWYYTTLLPNRGNVEDEFGWIYSTEKKFQPPLSNDFINVVIKGDDAWSDVYETLLGCNLDIHRVQFRPMGVTPQWLVQGEKAPDFIKTHPASPRTKWPPFWQTTFSKAFSWMKMIEFRFKFHWNLFPGVQLTTSQHWFW